MPAHIRRDYGPAHRATRRHWALIVELGTVTCARADTGECLEANPLILPGQAWQLDHVDGGSRPSHKRCNEVAGARAGNATRQPPWFA